MALPLSKVVPDAEPGGMVLAGMNRINALTNAMHETEYNRHKAALAPYTLGAEAASKLAYARLMGPQYIAKMLADAGIKGNLSEDQLNKMLGISYTAGTGQNAGNPLSNLPGMEGITAPKKRFSLSEWAMDKLRSKIEPEPDKTNALLTPQPQQAPSNNINAFNAPLTNQQPVQSIPNNQGQQMASPSVDEEELRNIANEWSRSPEGQMELSKENPNIPEDAGMLAWDAARKANKTYAEKEAEFKGITKEGEEAGKTRNEDINLLNTTVFNAETNKETLGQLSDILASKEFETIRNVPLAGRHELDYYSREGTPAQQEMIGQYRTLTGNLIKDASRDFAGQFRKGEQQLLNGMKPNASDTVDSARGKTEALFVLNEMLGARSRLTSKIMNQYHINKLEASELADKQINGMQIRKRIHDRLYPNVTIKNKKTGETKTISASEARKLGVPNV